MEPWLTSGVQPRNSQNEEARSAVSRATHPSAPTAGWATPPGATPAAFQYAVLTANVHGRTSAVRAGQTDERQRGCRRHPKRTCVLLGLELLLQGAERRCQGEGEETRHEWVPLFAALRLRDDVGGPTGSSTVRGLFSIPQPGKRQQCIGCGGGLECSQHGGAADYVIGRSRIQRDDGQLQVSCSTLLEGVDQGFRTSSCGQCIPVRQAPLLEVRGKVLCQGAGDDPAQQLTDDKAADTCGHRQRVCGRQ